MEFYQVFIAKEGLYPFNGFPTGLIHKTLEGAWSEIGDILEGLFEEHHLSTLEIKEVDVNIASRKVLVSYARIGFSQTAYSIRIKPVLVVE